jgi:hypothetical protein
MSLEFLETQNLHINNQVSNYVLNIYDTSENIVFGDFATVSGGVNNSASFCASTVGGGSSNTSSGTDSTISGGCRNSASGCASAILGGICNSTNNRAYAMIVGSNITAVCNCTLHANCLLLANIPTESSAPFAPGVVYKCSLTGALHIA